MDPNDGNERRPEWDEITEPGLQEVIEKDPDPEEKPSWAPDKVVKKIVEKTWKDFIRWRRKPKDDGLQN